MNVIAINNLAAFLENIPSKHNRGFNMTSYMGSTDLDERTNVGFQCNSTACIAGWASLVLGKNGEIRKTARKKSEVDDFYEDFATELLGLDYRTGLELFEPMNQIVELMEADWDEVTPRQAAKVLRNLAKTGEVDWSIALEAA
ncbi:MAG: hypothetical protein EOR25_15640 [Mesorhizobium sp.]|uniref:hypothetical protein n=1 Tax=Mesorhizobium sp. TaxID=1871066 RepID=UPI000FE3AC3D|nr:hypothetical protein [Mesorhizobium sp.]RWI47582.1 MAG: hypothetical protein EOR15_13970 [Mesorhizobium sp.]RWI88216.1 MAG: hypothetical protein EOR20_04025 [Mesorhizobium sp.]RWJ09644.1 MAG: hypothetical protein EOR24_18330 [Mesorhizobium sp.]RWJ16323.1 MAG: hypothetical protein EOR25_15640 [Mesorhizobium sp.]RWJ56823.1 MAG: hypothetical protein EOR32_33285 [Mesorhizobium sp.]